MREANIGMRGRAALVKRLAVLACALASLAGVATAATALKAPGKVFAGKTSETQPLSFTVVGKQVRGFSTFIGYDGLCGQGGGPVYPIKVATMKIGKGGRFSAAVKGRFTPPTPGAPTIPVRVKGRISGTTATGTVSETGAKAHCPPPNQKKLFYFERFTASSH